MWQRWHGFIEKASVACSLCGGRCPVHLGGAEHGAIICPACSRNIPWIHSVQCVHCGRAETCPDCIWRTCSYIVSSRSAVKYDDRMKQVLYRYKYRGDERLQHVCAHMMHDACRRQIALLPDNTRFDGITYVPLSGERMRERGFNQSEQLARGLGIKFGLPVHSLLQRTRHTDKQSFKARRERLQDLEGAFAADRFALGKIHGPLHFLLLVDDVYTTGSTMQQCGKILTEATGAKIYGLTWAR